MPGTIVFIIWRLKNKGVSSKKCLSRGNELRRRKWWKENWRTRPSMMTQKNKVILSRKMRLSTE